ncbi:Gfo/Idh/MocA family protein [Motilimonas eburnea]|uniref:Gfo/Idh/MocA family protein n=1 Tax=Motilimonas eburnea TaxID=1737488 RepID=UPI001E3F564A|nr:Gfo/Idh/MocA family oxidoreductase [Motilimonas eburnea]MCE2571344.1 Gfo/Idh/MocA family oxidoreductase [Motilimonas eburnea]
MTQPLKIALVGLGDIAQKAWLPIVCQHQDIIPVFCTRNTQVLDKLAAQYRISETYHHFADLVQSKPDAIMIHSATASHFELAKASIQAGIATLVDKPISDNLQMVAELVNLAHTHNTILYTGFNRRFAPLLSPLKQAELRHLRWQKNRHDLPGDIRRFIYDDFIHVVDSLLYYAHFPAIEVEQLDIQYQMKQQQLASVHLRINTQDILLEGYMNRLAGSTFERIEAFAENEHWQIDDLRTGHHCRDGATTAIGFSDWQSTLHKRGFEPLLEDWLALIKAKSQPTKDLDRLLTSHHICEYIVNFIQAKTSN